MRVVVDLTVVPPTVTVTRNPYDSDDEQQWEMTIYPSGRPYGGPEIEILADSRAALVALGEAIIAAAGAVRP